MPNTDFRKLFSQSPKLPAATPHRGSDATPSAANALPHSMPHSTPHSIHQNRLELESWGYIDASNKQNCNNISVTDNSVDNRVDQSVTNINRTIGTKIINLNYLSRCSDRSSETSRKVHFMVPYSRNEGFIGISQTLAWLKEKIKRGGDNHHRVALWGMGGIGKTQDVLECIYHYQSSQQLSVFWIHAGSQLQFEKDYRKLARLAGLLVSDEQDDVKQDIRLVVKGWLEGPESGNWILVLDNADNQLDFFKSAHAVIETTGGTGLADFIPHGSKGTVIITTRDREVASWLVGARNILDKTVMDSTQAKQLFIQNYPKAIEYTGSEGNAISLLLAALQYLPLAISQVTAYLRQNILLLPSEYLNLFRATKDVQKELLSKPFNDIRRECQSETVLTTFSISFRQLQEQSPLASSLLKLMACIDNQCIPHELLVCSIGENGQTTQLQLVEALSKLIHFGLLSTSKQGKDYEMHSLVHVSINSFISAQEKDAAVKQVANIFRRIYPEMWIKSYNPSVLYLPHASVLLNYMGESCQDRVYLYSIISRLFLSAGNFSTAEEHAKQAVKLGTDIFGPEHPDTLLAICNLAIAYKNQGCLKKAEELEVQIMEIQKRKLGPGHPDTLEAIGNLASTYWNQGRLKEAEELDIQVMKARKRVLGPEHPDTLIAKHNLGSTYRNQGRLKEAEELDIQVMEARKRLFGPEHQDTLKAIGNLALTYRDQGRLVEAEELGIQVMEARKKVLGPEHPDTLIAINNLAAIYREQERLKEAEQLGVQVMETWKRVLDPEHPHTLIAIGNLASIYRDQGYLKEAEELEVQVIEVQKRVLGPDHPETLFTIENIALTYRDQGRLMEAEELGFQVMRVRKRVLGSEHPDTLRAISNLAATYRDKGRLKEAEELGIQVMETRKRVLGSEHPDTLRAISGLAATYRDQGRLEEMEGLKIQVMEARNSKRANTGRMKV